MALTGRARRLPPAGLFAADFLFIAATVAHRHLAAFADADFSIDTERGYGELFQYAQLAALVLVLAHIARRAPGRGLWSWAAVYAYALADDAFQIHERLAPHVRSLLSLDPRFGLDPDDIAEALVLGLTAAALGATLVVAWRRARPLGPPRWVPVTGAVYLFCGVVLDLVHSRSPGSLPLLLLEDGGEMVAISVALAFAWGDTAALAVGSCDC